MLFLSLPSQSSQTLRMAAVRYGCHDITVAGVTNTRSKRASVRVGHRQCTLAKSILISMLDTRHLYAYHAWAMARGTWSSTPPKVTVNPFGTSQTWQRVHHAKSPSQARKCSWFANHCPLKRREKKRDKASYCTAVSQMLIHQLFLN